MMLAGAESGTPNILVVILGNLFVCGMEGLIVGIRYFVWNTTRCSPVSTKVMEESFEPYNTKQ